MFASTPFKSFLEDTTSTCPYFIKYSAVWKSAGSFCLIVCSITLRPANPTLAPCSAIIISPNVPKLAVTPPKVGSVITFMYNKPA